MDRTNLKKPNLFLVGVARAGTTSWHHYLKQHPEIFMSEEQRPNFFGEYDDVNARYFDTEEKYMSLFEGVKNQKIIGESSHLLGYANAPNQIKKFNPEAKIIIILRSPVEVIRSALDAGFGLINLPSLFFTLRELLYAENLKRWIDAFGKKNVHVMIYDDYVKDIRSEYKKVCNFLGIDNNFQPDFKNVHFSSIAHYPFFMRFVFFLWNKIPFPLRLKIKIRLGKKKEGLQEKYRKFDNHEEIKTRISELDKKDIQKAFFLNEIEKTEKIIGRDLSIWKY